MKIIKRDGSEAPFDRSKIEKAIRGANSDVEPEDRMAEELLVQLAVEIEERCLHLGHEPHVEEVQEMVEDAILAEGLTVLGKNYVRYRYVRQLARHANTTDAAVLSILDCVNEEAKQENSNKDPKINSVQRDYMAGELSRDITERLLLPPDIVEAHKEGIIHFHDSDYYAQREHNCFASETAFLTMGGIKHFDEFEDGVSTFVLDRHGKWREATVHSFGTQVVNEVTLESAMGSRKVVRVTANHRWLLASGDFTEFLSVGDVLMDSPGQKCGWHVAAIKPNVAEEKVWCVTEPVTHTFTLAGYVVTGNCDLVNLNDMLQNGTVISETLIERPHSFATACNIATQIIAQVASNQYGGQSITLAHLAPFVDVSRKAIRTDLESKNERLGLGLTEAQIGQMVEEDVRAEVKKGIQTIQYQLITLMTTNGQAPFLTVSMYLDEVPEGQIREDLAMMIEETLLQRYEGVKNEAGAWITPAFPKLIYVLDEDNVRPGSKYFHLTQLAAKCTAKRLVPDYVSAKKMRELKLSKGEEPGKGDVYPPMGCNAPDEVVTYRFHGQVFTEGLGRMWRRLAMYHPVKDQAQATDPTTDVRTGNYYLDLAGVEIWDSGVPGWVDCLRIVKNNHQKLLRLKFTNGRGMDCTPDHMLTTTDGREVKAKDLETTDAIPADFDTPAVDGDHTVQEDIAWLLGVCVCDTSYVDNICLSIAATGEDEIAERFSRIVKNQFGLDTKTIVQQRERKGTYKDVRTISNGTDAQKEATDWLTATLGGQAKVRRQLPPDFLSWDESARLALLGGIIDADGHIKNDDTGHCTVGSTNKELAQQEMLLAQSLGMPVRVYQNHYKGVGRGDTIRYAVNFDPRADLKDYVCCAKKRNRMTGYGTQPTPKPMAQLGKITELPGRHATFDVTTTSEHFTVAGLRSHNCRSFLTPDRSGNGFRNVSRALDWTPKPKYWGRFNQGVVTINLVDVALSSKGDEDAFWAILDERLELCHRALRLRHERLKGTLSDAAPILWQHGALARLDPGETIDKLLYGGYSTISLGYAGLYECVKYMMGVSHTEPEKGRPFGLAVMQALNDACTRWKVAEDIDYSVYGTPIESTTYKFAKCLQRRFGIIPGITDHGYITNSYHVCVREEIDAFSKLAFESDFQALSPGGAISYVEVPDMQDNLEAVIAVMQFIYDHIIYAELNTKSDYCQKCGFDGEIRIVEDDGKLVWECPNCGNRDQDTMNVARRTCGYIGTQYWNQGRTQEIAERTLHL